MGEGVKGGRGEAKTRRLSALLPSPLAPRPSPLHSCLHLRIRNDIRLAFEHLHHRVQSRGNAIGQRRDAQRPHGSPAGTTPPHPPPTPPPPHHFHNPPPTPTPA